MERYSHSLRLKDEDCLCRWEAVVIDFPSSQSAGCSTASQPRSHVEIWEDCSSSAPAQGVRVDSKTWVSAEGLVCQMSDVGCSVIDSTPRCALEVTCTEVLRSLPSWELEGDPTMGWRWCRVSRRVSRWGRAVWID